MTRRFSRPGSAAARSARAARAARKRALAVVLFAWGSSSCAPSGFQSISLVQNGIRILASSATEPYASPGDTVAVSVLAYDGRTAVQHAQNPEPMRVYWLPFLCEDPPQDAYYSCFPQFAMALGDGGAGVPIGFEPPSSSNDNVPSGNPTGCPDRSQEDSGEPDGSPEAEPTGLPSPPPIEAGLSEEMDAAPFDAGQSNDSASSEDADAASTQPVVSSQSFVIPRDAVIAHAPIVGTTPYGLLIAFNVACAGELRLFPGSNPNPQALPLQCVDPSNNGSPVGPESYVFGFSRIYAYAPEAGITNQNPILVSLDVESPGAPVVTIPLTGGPSVYRTADGQPLTLARCDPATACSNVKIGPVLCPNSWEPNGARHEELWADYFATFGGFTDSSRLLYDPNLGLIGPPSFTDSQFQPPSSSGDGFIWIVVHDDRGGASWISLPVHLTE